MPRDALWWVLRGDAGRLRAPWRLLGHAILLVALLLVVGLVVAVIGVAGLHPTVARVLAVLLGGLAVLASVAIAARWLDRRPLADLGVTGPAADFAVGLAAGGGAMAGVFLTELAAGWVTVVAVGHSPPGGSLAVGLATGAVLMAAVAGYEELLVRGYWLTNLAEGLRWADALTPRRAIAVAVCVTGLGFGVLHGANPGATAASAATIAVAGAVLGAAYAVTDSLALPVGFHAGWNYAQAFVFGFPTSGLEFGTALLAVRQRGPAVATGGDFGPEGGLVGLAWLLVGAAAMAWWVRRTRGRVAVQQSVAEPSRRG